MTSELGAKIRAFLPTKAYRISVDPGPDALTAWAREADILADLLARESDNTQHAVRANLDLIKRLKAANDKLEALRAVHAEYFNMDVSAYDADEDTAREDVWRYDRDFRAVLEG